MQPDPDEILNLIIKSLDTGEELINKFMNLWKSFSDKPTTNKKTKDEEKTAWHMAAYLIGETDLGKYISDSEDIELHEKFIGKDYSPISNEYRFFPPKRTEPIKIIDDINYKSRIRAKATIFYFWCVSQVAPETRVASAMETIIIKTVEKNNNNNIINTDYTLRKQIKKWCELTASIMHDAKKGPWSKSDPLPSSEEQVKWWGECKPEDTFELCENPTRLLNNNNAKILFPLNTKDIWVGRQLEHYCNWGNIAKEKISVRENTAWNLDPLEEEKLPYFKPLENILKQLNSNITELDLDKIFHEAMEEIGKKEINKKIRKQGQNDIDKLKEFADIGNIDPKNLEELITAEDNGINSFQELQYLIALQKSIVEIYELQINKETIVETLNKKEKEAGKKITPKSYGEMDLRFSKIGFFGGQILKLVGQPQDEILSSYLQHPEWYKRQYLALNLAMSSCSGIELNPYSTYYSLAAKQMEIKINELELPKETKKYINHYIEEKIEEIPKFQTAKDFSPIEDPSHPLAKIILGAGRSCIQTLTYGAGWYNPRAHHAIFGPWHIYNIGDHIFDIPDTAFTTGLYKLDKILEIHEIPTSLDTTDAILSLLSLASTLGLEEKLGLGLPIWIPKDPITAIWIDKIIRYTNETVPLGCGDPMLEYIIMEIPNRPDKADIQIETGNAVIRSKFSSHLSKIHQLRELEKIAEYYSKSKKTTEGIFITICTSRGYGYTHHFPLIYEFTNAWDHKNEITDWINILTTLKVVNHTTHIDKLIEEKTIEMTINELSKNFPNTKKSISELASLIAKGSLLKTSLTSLKPIDQIMYGQLAFRGVVLGHTKPNGYISSYPWLLSGVLLGRIEKNIYINKHKPLIHWCQFLQTHSLDCTCNNKNNKLILEIPHGYIPQYPSNKITLPAYLIQEGTPLTEEKTIEQKDECALCTLLCAESIRAETIIKTQ